MDPWRLPSVAWLPDSNCPPACLTTDTWAACHGCCVSARMITEAINRLVMIVDQDLGLNEFCPTGDYLEEGKADGLNRVDPDP